MDADSEMMARIDRMPRPIPKVNPELEATAWIYFIVGEDSGRIKIGSAKNPQARLAMLQTGSPERLLILGAIFTSRSFERSLHVELQDYRLHGEWFEPSLAVKQRIRELLGADEKTAQQLESQAKADALWRELQALKDVPL